MKDTPRIKYTGAQSPFSMPHREGYKIRTKMALHTIIWACVKKNKVKSCGFKWFLKSLGIFLKLEPFQK